MAAASDRPSRISRAVARIEVSAIKRMAMLGAATPGSVSLAWGLPSFPTPEPIRRAVADALAADPDIGKYALPDGVKELREAAAAEHQARTGVAVDPDRQIIVTAGNMQGLNALFHTLLEPGDEVILTDPGFSSHYLQIRLCGGRPVPWKLNEDEDWSLDPGALERLVGPSTKAIVLVTPSNPTGRIFTEAALRRVGEIALARGVLLVLDDPYSRFTYGSEPTSFNLASLPELKDSLAYHFTFSKSYAMSGWRIAYAVLPPELKPQVLKVHDATVICAPRIAQVAALAALKAPPDHIAEFSAVLERRRALICERLDAMSHAFSYARPQGAYYVFPRLLMPHQDSLSFATHLVAECGVVVTPGSAFGPSGEHHVRMAYCVEDTAIEEAFDRLERHFPKE